METWGKTLEERNNELQTSYGSVHTLNGTQSAPTIELKIEGHCAVREGQRHDLGSGVWSR